MSARALSVHGTQRACEDTVVHVADALDDEEALEVALEATGETRVRLFGWRVGSPDEAGIRVVRLHTD